ncbi:MAG: glycosyltransferase family 4 protein [Clostridia bacterium]|nr:glycosyltransferase family 4 protein [Clostridia bacterium]
MNILFLSIGRLSDLTAKSLYPDLLRQLKDQGNNVFVVCPRERRMNLNTEESIEYGIKVLRVKIGNITKTNLIEKGLSTLFIEQQFKSAIKKYYKDVKFDLVLYSTPPITFAGVINYVKKRDNAKSYLLLKDIFPQNAVDLGMFSKKSPIYWFFRQKEKQLYRLSDSIGCMSQANVDYVLKHNPKVEPCKVHVNPNSVEAIMMDINPAERKTIREKYGIPENKKVFIYGGNLGKPQGIPFLIECLKAAKSQSDAFFVVSGTGTEYPKLKTFNETEKPENVLLINGLPREEYETLVSACDVGLIFLDHRFTIPNFPSRLLSYMQDAMPVLACTDPNTDVGKVIEDGGFGWWCESNDASTFSEMVEKVCCADLIKMGEQAYEYLKEHYTVEKSCDIIMNYVVGAE